ncbi:MAG: 50S ribosomal protein L4 [Candidatus Babeliales bacterium]
MVKAQEIITDIAVVVTPSDLSLDPKKKVRLNREGLALWVRSLLQNWRQGTVASKDRGEVAFTNKKPWKQKGTGRARAGSARSPLWRGGGASFGPQERSRTLSVPKSLKKNVLQGLLWEFLGEKRLINLDWHASSDMPKTKFAYEALKKAGLEDKKITLFLPVTDHMSQVSFANLPNVNILFFDQANAYDLVNSEHWVFLKKDAPLFKEMVERWN